MSNPEAFFSQSENKTTSKNESNEGLPFYKKFIPHIRHVKDHEVFDSAEDKLSEEITQIEYRDEAGRKWWKFFDEYEYRLNKFDRAKHKWFRWFEEGTSKEEKKLITKLDFLVAFYLLVTYWLKSLDSSNISNAYVSGMSESLKMGGTNGLINAITCYNVAAVVFQLPFAWILPRYSIHYIIPLLDIGWGIFTLFTYRVNTVNQLYVMRFFVGAFEAVYYICAHTLLANFYTAYELNRRGAIYYIGQMLGTITSGLFQATIHTHLNGKNGLEGWRWMFIIDGLITIPIGILGFYIIPGSPNKCYSLFLSDDEIRLSRTRLTKKNIKTSYKEGEKSIAIFDKKLWKKIFSDWKVYALTLYSIGCWNNSSTSGSGYILWLKTNKNYNIAEVNNLSTLTPSLGVAWIILWCGSADMFLSRYGAVVGSQVLNFISNLILTIWDVPKSAKWTAFLFQYNGWSSASVIYATCNDILRHDPQERAIIWIFLYSIAQGMNVWITRVVWPTVDSPKFSKGYPTTMGFAIFTAFMSIVVLFFYKKSERAIAEQNGIVLYDSSKGDVPPDHASSSEGEEYIDNKEKDHENVTVYKVGS